MNYFRAIFSIVKKDALMEWRSKEAVNSMLVFALLVTIVFSFIFEPGSDTKGEVVGGIFWIAVIFSGLLGLNKSMVSEIQGGNLEALLLSPVERSAIFFGKFLSNMLFMLFMEAILIPLFTVFYDVNIIERPEVILVIFLATYGFCLIGTLFSIISVKTKTREIMLPLMLLPIMVPVILGAILSTNVFIGGEPSENAGNWITLIASFDVIFTAIIFAIFGLIIEE